MLKFVIGVMVVVTAEVLLLGTESGVPAGVETEAPLVIVPVLDPRTVPVIVTTTLLPTGICGSVAATLLPEIEKLAGQRAPPVAEVQVVAMPLMAAGELSVKLALKTSLGPLFLNTRV